MDPTLILTETYPNNTLPPNIALSEFKLLETTPTTQEIITNPKNIAAVSWDKLAHHKLTMESTITALTRKY